MPPKIVTESEDSDSDSAPRPATGASPIAASPSDSSDEGPILEHIEHGKKPAAPAAAPAPALTSSNAAPTKPVEPYVIPDLLPPKVAKRKYPHRYANVHEPQQEDNLGHQNTYEIRSAWFLLRVFLTMLDWSAFTIMMLSCGVTFLCMNFHWATDMPLTLLAAGIIFPISFSISYASNRRERVLLDIASLKASIVALYQLHRDFESAFKKPARNYSEDCRKIMTSLVTDIEVYIQHQGGKERLHRIYQNFDELSRIHESLRREDDWVKSVLSRLYQYERYMINDFERLRVIHDFRTAATLRGYAFMFLYFFPILLAPLFANYARLYGTWSGIFISITSSFMVVSLYRVSACMEDPFDEIGVDDVNIGMLSEALKHLF